VLVFEIAAQGVRGAVPASGRATLRPGYNVVAADGAALGRLLDALLHPGAGDADALGRAGASAGARAGITLTGDDGVSYRLVRELRGSAQLHRYDAATRSFSLVASDLGAIAAALADPIGVPPRARLRSLLSIRAAELPSRRGAALRPTPAPVASRRADPHRGTTRVEALRAELERSLASEKLQFRLDALQTRLFKSEEALREAGRVEEDCAGAQRALHDLERIAAAEAALGDADARLVAYERARAKHEEARVKAEEERLAIDADAAHPPPIWRVPGVWAGTASGVAAVAVALAGAPASPGLRYVALLDVPAFGCAAWAALGWIRRLEEASRGERRRKVVDDFERKATEQFEREAAAVHAALSIAGAANVVDLRERLAKLREARAAAAAAEARRAAWEASPEVGDAREARGRLEDEIREVETQLASTAGGFARDVRTIELELQRAEAEGDPRDPAGAPEVPREVLAPAPPDAPANLVGVFLAAAAAERGGDAAPRLRDLAARAGELAAALSGGRLSIALDGAAVRVVAGGRATPEALAAPGDRDVCWLAARIAVLERALASRPALALADDAFAVLPEGGRRAAARLLKQAARGGQLIHATADAAFQDAADHVAA
jgi:hypothetical protein